MWKPGKKKGRGGDSSSEKKKASEGQTSKLDSYLVAQTELQDEEVEETKQLDVDVPLEGQPVEKTNQIDPIALSSNQELEASQALSDLTIEDSGFKKQSKKSRKKKNKQDLTSDSHKEEEIVSDNKKDKYRTVDGTKEGNQINSFFKISGLIQKIIQYFSIT